LFAAETVVALDWSGAKAANGISVAQIPATRAVTSLILPPDGPRWTRTHALDYLCRQASHLQKTLVGIDCSFSLPFSNNQYLPELRAQTAQALWIEVNTVSLGASDFYAGPFAAAHTAEFWQRGKRPSEFIERHRKTEKSAAAAGMGRPESPLKLIGAKQVGMAGLAGMRVLNALKQRCGDAVCIWPFESITSETNLVVVEIYPTLFRLSSGAGLSKIRDVTALRTALSTFNVDFGPYAPENLTDHDTDALISAAGMLGLRRETDVWKPSGLDDKTRQTEGWIFGVP